MYCKLVKLVSTICILLVMELWSYSPYQHAYEQFEVGVVTWDEYQELIERIEYTEWAKDSLECEALFEEYGITLDTGGTSHSVRAEYSFNRDIERDSLLRSNLKGSLTTKYVGMSIALYPHSRAIQSRSVTLKNGGLRTEWGSITLRQGGHSITAPRVLGNSESSLSHPKRGLNGGLLEYTAKGTSILLGGSYNKYSREDGNIYSKLVVVSARKQLYKGHLSPMVMYGHIYSSDYVLSERMPLGGLVGEVEKEGRIFRGVIYSSGGPTALYGKLSIKSTVKSVASKLSISYRTSAYRDFVLTRVGYEKDTVGAALVVNQGQELLVVQSHKWVNNQWELRYGGTTSINKGESVFHRSRITTALDLGSVKGQSVALWSDISQSGIPLLESQLSYHRKVHTIGLASTIHNRNYSGNRWLPSSIFLSRSLPYLFDDRFSITLPRLDYREKQLVIDYRAECAVLSNKRLNFETKISLEMYDFKKVTRPKLFFKMSTAL
ncbi:MAG: hypothetical protein OCD01_16230 [Fibrobacterales bacterium]